MPTLVPLITCRFIFSSPLACCVSFLLHFCRHAPSTNSSSCARTPPRHTEKRQHRKSRHGVRRLQQHDDDDDGNDARQHRVRPPNQQQRDINTLSLENQENNSDDAKTTTTTTSRRCSDRLRGWFRRPRVLGRGHEADDAVRGHQPVGGIHRRARHRWRSRVGTLVAGDGVHLFTICSPQIESHLHSLDSTLFQAPLTTIVVV